MALLHGVGLWTARLFQPLNSGDRLWFPPVEDFSEFPEFFFALFLGEESGERNTGEPLPIFLDMADGLLAGVAVGLVFDGHGYVVSDNSAHGNHILARV